MPPLKGKHKITPSQYAFIQNGAMYNEALRKQSKTPFGVSFKHFIYQGTPRSVKVNFGMIKDDITQKAINVKALEGSLFNNTLAKVNIKTRVFYQLIL